MGFVLTYGGINKFGITAVLADSNGNIINTSNPITNPNANSGGSGIGSNTAGIPTTVFGYNPTYVNKSSQVRTATQMYYYGLLDDIQYDTAQVLNTRPFNQNYISKKSTVSDDTYRDAVNLATSRSADYVGGSANTAVKVARLSSLYLPTFTGLYDSRSPLEITDSVGNSTLIEVTASMDFYNIPTSADLLELTIQLNASASMIAAALGTSVNVVMPNIDWHNITFEPEHPDGEGNYYPYKTISDTQSSQGIIYDIEVDQGSLSALKPVITSVPESPGGYWFGNPPVVNGPEDRIGPRYFDSSTGLTVYNDYSWRRDPIYISVEPFVSFAAIALSQYDMTSILQTGNAGGPYLPVIKPTGQVVAETTSQQTYTYDWTQFASVQGMTQANAVQLLAPKVRVTARLNFAAANNTIFTKGTYSHIEIPKVLTTGDQFTPSVLICHDKKKIYYFIYSYQDNESCVAYNVLRECEEDDKRTWMPLPPTSIYYNPPPPAPPPPPTPPPPLPPPNIGTGTVMYDPSGPVYPGGGN